MAVLVCPFRHAVLHSTPWCQKKGNPSYAMFKQTIFHGAKLLFSSECRLFSSQSHGITARSFPALRTRKSIYSQRSMKTCPLSPETRALSTKTSRLSRPVTPPRFSPPRPHARTCTRTQRVFDFCLHRTSIHAQSTENKRIAGEPFTLFPSRHIRYNSLCDNPLR